MKKLPVFIRAAIRNIVLFKFTFQHLCKRFHIIAGIVFLPERTIIASDWGISPEKWNPADGRTGFFSLHCHPAAVRTVPHGFHIRFLPEHPDIWRKILPGQAEIPSHCSCADNQLSKMPDPDWKVRMPPGTSVRNQQSKQDFFCKNIPRQM